MALINCPECNKQISDRASACPDCACPIAAQPATAAAPGPKVQTIEATGKKWKGMRLAATIGIVISLFGVFGTADANTAAKGFWGVVALISLAAIIYARLGSWWNHQ